MLIKQTEQWAQRWFEFCLYLILIGIPVSRALVEIGSTGALAGWIWLGFIRKNWGFRSSPVFWPLLGYTLFSGLSYFWSAHPAATLSSWVGKTIQYSGLYLAAWGGLRDLKTIRRLLWATLAIAAIICADGLYQIATGHDFFLGYGAGLIAEGRRMTASLKYPNDLGAYLGFVFWIGAGILWADLRAKQVRCLALSLLSAVIAGCVVLTYSRSAWMGLGAALFFFTLLSRKKKMAWIAAIGLMTLAALLPTRFMNRGSGFFDIHAGSSSEERLLVWDATWKMIQDRPAAGSGLNTFNAEFRKYKPEQVWGNPYVHNSYLQMTAEQGFIGLILFLSILVGFFSYGLGINPGLSVEGRLAHGLSAGLVGYLVHSFFDSNLYILPLAALFWTFMGITNRLYAMAAARTHPEKI